jgi:hypothetical protein
MNATAPQLTSSLRLRLTGAALAALVTLGLVSALSQVLHVERLGESAQLVELDRVIVTATRAAADAAVAAIPAPTRAN